MNEKRKYPPTMHVGGVYLYEDKPVYITDGQYESNGRISNYWRFRYINKNGSLGESGGDYGGCFEKYTGKATIKIILS
jgi:hypothetical protein